MKTILLISHSSKLGGAERCLLEAAVGLKKRGYIITVIVPAKDELLIELMDSEINTIIQSHPWWLHLTTERLGLFKWIKKTINICRYTYKFIKLIREIDPEVVLSNTLDIPCGAIASKVLKKKHYWFIHEFGEEDHRHLFDYGIKLSTYIIDKLSKRVLVNSNLVKSKFSKFINNERFDIIPYNIPKPICDKKFNYKLGSTNEVNLLIVGQIKENKGQFDALKAVVLLKSAGYNVRLLVIGSVIEIEYYDQLLKYIDENELHKNVVINKHVKTPFALVESFDTIGLMCSRFEALGRVTVEYMKLRIPVIIAADDKVSLVEDMVTGIHYKSRDSLDLFNKILFLINNERIRNEIIDAAEDFAINNFTEENYINKLLSAFNIR